MLKQKENERREDTFVAIHFYVQYKGTLACLKFSENFKLCVIYLPNCNFADFSLFKTGL